MVRAFLGAGAALSAGSGLLHLRVYHRESLLKGHPFHEGAGDQNVADGDLFGTGLAVIAPVAPGIPEFILQPLHFLKLSLR